jgi:HAE1 family hydrophobic/amphiphilic exporter-1
VIAFGILISTVLGRFVIPVYYVLGERLIRAFSRGETNQKEELDPHGKVAMPENGAAAS